MAKDSVLVSADLFFVRAGAPDGRLRPRPALRIPADLGAAACRRRHRLAAQPSGDQVARSKAAKALVHGCTRMRINPCTCVFGLHVLSWGLLHFAVAASRLRLAFEPRQLNPKFLDIEELSVCRRRVCMAERVSDERRSL